MAPEAEHTYGSECRLATPPPLPADEAMDGIPPLRSYFFYSSPIPIDDPLSTVTTGGTADSKSLLRPFSLGDNNALERAWLTFASDDDRATHAQEQKARMSLTTLSAANAVKLDRLVQQLILKHEQKHRREGQAAALRTKLAQVDSGGSAAACCSELQIDVSAELQNEFCALQRDQQRLLDQDRVIEAVMAGLQCTKLDSEPSDLADCQGSSGPASAAGSSFPNTPRASFKQSHPFAEQEAERARRRSVRQTGTAGELADVQLPLTASHAQPIPIRRSVADDGISGKPFLRVGADDASQPSPPASLPAYPSSLREARPAAFPRPENLDPVKSELQEVSKTLADEPRTTIRASADIVMKPIYWSPVNDISVVMRATWFYRDGITPVEAAIANQLEAGYRELRPWSQTWADELKSALDVGALGEEKVSHPLWPEPPRKKSRAKDEMPPAPLIADDPFCAARCFRGEAAAIGSLEPIRADEDKSAEPSKQYQNYHVLYKDANSAFLLKPSLKPSAYYSRRPLAKVVRGTTVGTPVVRGFDWDAWDRLNNRRKTPVANKSTLSDSNSQPDPSTATGCRGCLLDKQRGQVTDLVLIAHGIGQKLADRVESFHFTHAVNAFRRAINAEIQSEVVKTILREGQNGIMVLPVNWRHNLTFEEGGPLKAEDRPANSSDNFTLKDIEPKTIPAVRGMISDVMFDIPFYMSHHKPKMIAALVNEANRVYRLWCRNNPAFAQSGRVHLIAHSLGSAMALEVLSKQPTRVPRLSLNPEISEVKYFEFDTTNLFLLGSPAGFFLLLERGGLVPRRGRAKADAEPSDVNARDVVGDVGTFGCLAVDNIYNILAKEDPIAYLLNGTIDPKYAANLKVAYVPTSTISFMKSVGDAVRGMAGVPVASANTSTAPQKPPTTRLPSQLELEVHDFTREEIAEKKAFLLNDNGQIDYYLRSGGGPLEIQYLNMLSAHTSYWVNQDLIRMLCVEIGRKPGKGSTLEAMRAVKAARRPIPVLNEPQMSSLTLRR